MKFYRDMTYDSEHSISHFVVLDTKKKRSKISNR